MHTLKKEQTKPCTSNCYDSVVWNSSKALFHFFNNRNTKRRHRKIPQRKQLLHRWKTSKSMMNLTFTLKKKWSKLLTPQQELEKKKTQAAWEELIQVISSTWLYWHAHLVLLAPDHGRLEPVPDDIREGGGVHPGQATQPRSELHLQTESAAHLSDTSSKSGRRLQNWLCRRERGKVPRQKYETSSCQVAAAPPCCPQ